MINTKIEYTIDNFSGILKKDKLEKYIEVSKAVNRRGFASFVPTKMIGCYIIYDKDKNIIYIGKSSCNIRSRLCTHIMSEIKKKDYYYSTNSKLYQKRLDLKRDGFYFAYIKIDKQYIDFVERGLINKYTPKYNIEYNNIINNN